MLFTIRDILTLKDGRRRVWGYFGSLSTVVGDEKLTSREDLIGLLFFMFRVMKTRFLKLMKFLKPKPNRLMSLINLLVASSFAFE